MKEKTLKILKSSFLFAFVLNAVFLALCVVFTSFTYESDVDYYNSLYICRDHMYTNATINYVLAMLIGTAQYAFPGINCFVIFEVMASFAAFVSITFVFADKYNKRKAFVFATVLNIMFALHHYTNVDSTRTAALVCAAGFLLILLAIYQKRYSLSCWVGVLELMIGSFMNLAYFFIALGFAVAFFFGDLIAKKKYRLPFQKLFWYFRPFLLMFIFVSLLALGLYQFSYSVNHATEQASDYYEYAVTENAVDSLPFPDYTEHLEEFEEVGITNQADYEMLKGGYYDADTVLNIDALKAVQKMQLKDKPNTIGNTILSVFTDNYEEITHLSRSIIVIAVYLTVSLIFILYHKNRFSFFPLFYFIVGCISSFVLRFFFSSGDNFTYGVWVFMVAMLLNSFNFEVLRSEKKSSFRRHNGYLILSCAVILLLAASNGLIYYNNRTVIPEKNSARFLLSEIDRNPDYYYVLDPATKEKFVKNTENYEHPMWGFRDGYLDNVDDFGYFHNEQTLRRRNMPQNIYRAVLDTKKTFVIDNNIVFKKERFFSAHYTQDGSRVTYTPESEPSGYKIYKVSVEKLDR